MNFAPNDQKYSLGHWNKTDDVRVSSEEPVSPSLCPLSPAQVSPPGSAGSHWDGWQFPPLLCMCVSVCVCVCVCDANDVSELHAHTADAKDQRPVNSTLHTHTNSHTHTHSPGQEKTWQIWLCLYVHVWRNTLIGSARVLQGSYFVGSNSLSRS